VIDSAPFLSLLLETERTLRHERVPRDHAAAELYRSHYPLLATIARRRFGLSQEEAENAIHDVFVSFLCTATVIRNPIGWLVGAICNACREHWRHRTRTFELSKTDFSTTNLEESILSRQVLQRLPLSSQRVLTLHYIEGLTAAEIAVRLHTTRRYAERLIHRGLQRARREAGKADAAF
jgi:RNA polymerase sigma factor (sigma-70 family)